MKKRVLAVLAATALVGVASAYAANPFADVPTDSWAYQAVTTLAEQGVVVGYPDGYFKGERNITRYEMAQIIARAMAKEDRVNAEQQAMINKLADEFSTELNNLGVRVSNLEKRVGNVTLSGDARLKFVSNKLEGDKERSEDYTARVRLGAKAKVDDSTWVGARFVMNMGFGTDNTDTKNVQFDRLWVKHNFGAASMTAGRQGLFVGSGLVYDDTLDGVTVATNLDKVGLVAGYGYAAAEHNNTIAFVQAGFTPMEKTALKGYYARLHSDVPAGHSDIYGVALDYAQNGIQVGGEWAKVGNAKDNDAWTAYLGYGNYDQAKAGTWGVTGRYLDMGAGFASPYSTFGDMTWDKKADFKGWGVNGSYALADNLGLVVDYYFNAKTHNGTKIGNRWIAQLKYQF